MITIYLIESFGILLAGLLGYFFIKLYKQAPTTKTTELSNIPIFFYSKSAVVGFLLLILLSYSFHVWNLFHFPLNWDETQHSIALFYMNLEREVNLFNYAHHAVSSWASLFSFWNFGMDPIAGRYPALLFTALSYLMILKLCVKRFSPFTLLLILGQVFANRQLIHHLMEQRAYPLMFLVSLCTYYLISRFIESPNGLSKKEHGAYFLLAGLSFCTHFYSGIYISLSTAFIGLIILLDKKTVTKEKILSASKLIGSGIFWALVFSLTFPSYIKLLRNEKWISKEIAMGPLEILSSFVSIFALPFRKYEWLFILTIFSLTIFFIYLLKKNKIRSNEKHFYFYPFFLMFSFTALNSLFQTTVFLRTLIWFIVPALVPMSEVLNYINKKSLRIASKTFLFFLLCIIPYHYYSAISAGGGFPGNLEGFSKFVSDVKNKTSPIEENCYHFIGEPSQVEIATTIYFFDAMISPPKNCRNDYLLYFADVSDKLSTVQIPTPTFKHYEKIFEDPYHVRILFKKQF